MMHVRIKRRLLLPAALMAVGTVWGGEGPNPPLKVSNATHHIVYREEGRYASFPSLAIDPANEDLYTAFKIKDRISHFEGEDSEVMAYMKSSDGGVTWSKIDRFPDGLQDARPGLFSARPDEEAFHGGAFKLSDGSLARIGQNWRRWFPIERLREFKGKYAIVMGKSLRGPGEGTFAINSGGYIERSVDGGKTWTRKEIAELDTYASYSSPWSYVQLQGGGILRAFAVSLGPNEPVQIYAVITRDGETVEFTHVMGEKPGGNLGFTEEVLVHQTSKGVIWMLGRVHNGNGSWWQALSRNHGKSWKSHETDIDGLRTPPSGLVSLSDGRVVLVFGNRREPQGIHALVSDDEGITWKNDRRLSLRDDGHGSDLGYARAIRLSDDTIVTVYYYSTPEEVAESPLTRYIVATRFKVPELIDHVKDPGESRTVAEDPGFGAQAAEETAAGDPPPTARLVSVKKIWDKAQHNAFTDLIRFRDEWFCVFREGAGHVSPDGKLRVIASPDGKAWRSAALIDKACADLRDAKITVTPGGELMLTGAAAIQENGKTIGHQSFIWFSADGSTWSPARPIGDRDVWLWRTTWNQRDKTAYGAGYRTASNSGRIRLRLYHSKDGRTFDTLVPELLPKDTHPNETSILFRADGAAHCLLRHDGVEKNSLLGVAHPPYRKWAWKDLGVRIGGPHMIELPDGRTVAAVRLYDKPVRTALCWLDPEKASLEEFMVLPSGGDTSYAGLVWHDDHLWVSYYSSHEANNSHVKTAIYLAKVAFEQPQHGKRPEEKP